MKLTAFKNNTKGFIFTFENELGLPITIQCAVLPEKLSRLLTMIESAIDVLFEGTETNFIGFAIKEKTDQTVCIYEIKSYINGIRVLGKTEELYFGVYDQNTINLLSEIDQQRAEKFSQISDLIRNQFEIQAISDISQLMTASRQTQLFD